MSNNPGNKIIAFDKRTIYSLTLMAATLAVLALYPLRTMSYAGFTPVALLVTWLIYSFIAPVALLNRRAVLSHAMKEGSRLRRFLWHSAFVHVRAVVYAVFASAVALMAVSGFERIDWMLLFFSLPVLLLVIGVVRTRMAGEVAEHYEYWAATRVGMAVVLVALALISTVYNFFLVEVPYYANLSMAETVRESFTVARDEAAMREVGWLLGAHEAVNTALWHLMQVVSEMSGSTVLKIALWLVFLFISALRVGAVLLVLGGVIILVDSFLRSGKRPLGETVFSRSFTFTIVALFAAYLLLTQINVGRFLTDTGERVARSVPVSFDPCSNRQVAAQEEFHAEASKVLADAEQEAYVRMRDEIEESVDQLFSHAEAGVESFLDWNFSLTGQYQQLLFMGTRALGHSFSDYIGDQIDHHIGSALSAEESDLDGKLRATFFAEVERIQTQHAHVLVELAENADCLTLPELTFTSDQFMNKSPVGAGSGAGAGVMAVRGGIRVGSNAVGRVGAKRVIAAVAARLAARIPALTGAAAVGGFCGPAAIVCGPAFAGVTWVVTDLAINEIDETLNRQAMKDDILASLYEEKERVKAAYMEVYQHALAEAVGEMEESRTRMFNPSRDGV